MAHPTAPPSLVDLLEKPCFDLATVRPDGAPRSSVMWFAWDGDGVRFTHTRTRQKFKNLAHDPRVAFSIRDEANPYRFLEVRGQVESIEPDPGAAFYVSLQKRYGLSFPVHDADVRVVITVRPTKYVAVEGGMTERERAALKQKLQGSTEAS
ncbi:MAG: PPOX class F420-dependent oxidoreductase [Solirubrobacteraceae bacterium]